MDQEGEQLDPASIHIGSPSLLPKQSEHSHVAHPLSSLKIDERENDYAEIGPGPTSGTGGACKEDARIEIEPNANQSQQSHVGMDAIDVSPIEMSSGTGGACKEPARTEKEPKAKQYQPIKPLSIEACNELTMFQSHTEISSGTGEAYSELAEESLSLSNIRKMETNTNLNGTGCGVKSGLLLQESAPDCDATSREVPLALVEKSENCDLEATASSSTTTYNAVGNFQVGCDNEINTGEEYGNEHSCVVSKLFHALISFPHLHQIVISNFQVACGILNAGDISAVVQSYSIHSFHFHIYILLQFQTPKLIAMM